MQPKNLILTFILGFLFSCSMVFADDVSNSSILVSVDILEPVLSVEISPNNVDLGTLTKGYESDPINLTATNTGDIDVEIIPILNENAEDFFQYLEFATGSCSTYTNVSKWDSSIIDASDIFGGIGEEYSFCMHMDLKNYEDEIERDYLNISTDLTFWVVAA
jgi:hypothetical protein